MKIKCVYCNGTVVDSTTTDYYNWGNDYLVIIENVPCGICQECGEKYFEAIVTRQIEMLAHPLIKQASRAKRRPRSNRGRPSKKPLAVVNFANRQLLTPVQSET